MRMKPIMEIFKELCFCILTANYSAERAMKIQAEIGDGFLEMDEEELAKELKRLGHRFPRTRARYIVEARKMVDKIEEAVRSIEDEKGLRDWLAENVKGLGYKEASHFLRNIGFLDLAIIDFHILNLLRRYGLIEKPRGMSKRRYIELENLLRRVAETLSMKLGELDLYLWYMETGKILK